MRIKTITAREILDSRGTPTVAVTMTADEGRSATFAVPSGASTGSREALELRDGGNRYGGLGVARNIREINTKLSPIFISYELGNQENFDLKLLEIDGTDDKSKLGANTCLALSGGYLKLSAVASGQPLWKYLSQLTGLEASFPRLYANLVNGGKHAPGLDIQEFMVVPMEAKPSVAIERIVRFAQQLKKKLSALNPHSTAIGDEGGFVPDGLGSVEVLQLYQTICDELKLPMDFALDIAASSFYKDGNYRFGGNDWKAADLTDFYGKLDEQFNILSVEDPFAEDDIESHITLNKRGLSFFIVGDDTTVTDGKRIEELAGRQAIGGVIIKPNQIGTMTESLYAIRAAHRHQLKVIVSHRSGETNDDLIADLACGAGAYGLKLGAPARGERVAKYNRLLGIEQELKA